MLKNLRSFIEEYERSHPEDVIRISKPIRAEFEITAIAKHFERQNKFPLLIFERVINTKGDLSPFPCVINLLGDRNKLSFAIGSNYRDVALAWSKRIEQDGQIPPMTVPSGSAPSQENVYLGDEIDLLSLPMLRHHEMDPGPYITAGMLVTHDQGTWTANMAFQRGFVADSRELRSYIGYASHNYWNLIEHEKQGREMKVAYWIGHHPAFIMGAHHNKSYLDDHYTPSGSLAGEPMRLVPSVTLGNDFLVPAEAEFVIEGVIRPGRVAPEGPFGEFPRYYGPQRMSPVIEVTALTHRNDALWHSFMVGINNNYSSVRMERDIYAKVKRAVPQVQRVSVPVSGASAFNVYLQLKKTHEGQPKQAMMATFAASHLVKHVIVVDDDIDVYDDREVLWAIATRSQWDKDLILISGGMGLALDPSSYGSDAISAKAGIDATKPAPPKRFSVRLGVPGEVLNRVRLEDFIDEAKLAAVPANVNRSAESV